jgi:hypothetical protein
MAFDRKAVDRRSFLKLGAAASGVVVAGVQGDLDFEAQEELLEELRRRLAG